MADRDDILARLGANIRAERARRNLTQQQLADHADMHLTQLARMERGEVGFSVVKLVQIARAMDVPPSLFFEGV